MSALPPAAPDPYHRSATDAPAGERLDAALRALEPELSQKRARQLCAIGAVLVDGVRRDSTQRLAPGARIAWPVAWQVSLQLGMPVLHDQNGALVLYKLPGLAVHKGPLVDDSVADRLAAVFPGSGLAQRLDRSASGLLLCGRERAALAALGTAMESGAIGRCYLAIAHGVVAGERRTIDLPLFATDEPMGNRPKVVVDAQRGQRAVTHLEVLARARTATLVRLRLETGRTHQIRAHLRAIGHPLLGDPRYGDPVANAEARATHGIDRPLLHGERLDFPSPADGQAIAVVAPNEPDLARLFPQLQRRA